ncbi:MAG: radical SAM protein [Deltaproteobacteria bacterium]|nr:radical SAM protein [Deltaproteobacteria bacterium]
MDVIKSLKTGSKSFAISKTAEFIVKYVQKDPEKNFDSMMKNLASLDNMFAGSGQFKKMMEWIHANPGTRKWFIRLMTRDAGQVGTFVKNFFGNCSLKWLEKSKTMEKVDGLCPPFNILISPTMRCNLHCKGCYASSYSSKDDMDIETFDKIITEGKELGIYFYTILGGEPFMKFNDIYNMAKKHNDCLFQIFTNGTLITERIADKILDAKNIVVAFSVNGTKEDTGFIRGPGVYDRVLESIDMLRRRNLMYGMSLVLTSQNYKTFMSRDFLKFWEDQGIVFGWNFLFMPVGKDPDLSLMPTPEQRLTFGEFIKKYREKEPLYIMDFWADAPAVHGCIAGGRRYLHVNNRGDIEPCIFAHFSTHNIKECHLIDALKSPFFTFIRMHQPHTDNLLRPCMIIDNPQVLRDACRICNARPTEEGAEKLIEDPAIMKALDEYAAAVAKKADPIWLRNYQDDINDMYERKCSFGEGIDRVEYKLNRRHFLENAKRFAEKDPMYAKRMLEAAEHAYNEYGKDKERQIVVIKEVKTGMPGMHGQTNMIDTSATDISRAET